MSVIILLLMQS